MRILNLTDDTRKDILEDLLKRSPNNYGEFEGRVNAIISTVKEKRDEAVFSYTKQFDGADIDSSNISLCIKGSLNTIKLPHNNLI